MSIQHPSRRDWMCGVLGSTLAAATPEMSRSEPVKAEELPGITLKGASALIRAKKISPVELTAACLARIKAFNPKINAWITILHEQALAQAKILEKEQMAGTIRGLLHGIPIGLKDTIDTADVRTTAASAVYEYRVPTEDAEVSRRLRNAGAILIGKCNMHEFDAGPTSAVSYWGPVRNPWNLERIAGGPSGGSAAAVVMGQCYAALGTDSSGGIRTPAAYCGAVGFMPSYGRVSQRGLVPFAWSLDHCGPLTRTVEDAAIVLQQIAGYDLRDIDSIEHPVPDFVSEMNEPIGQFRIGVAPQFFDHLDDETAQLTDEAIAIIKKLTLGVQEVSLPSLLHANVEAEIAAFHENVRGVNGGGYEPLTARVFPASAENARAVDYIKGWRDLQMLRRTVTDSLFNRQGIHLFLAPTVRRAAVTIEESLVLAPTGNERAGGSGAGASTAGSAAGNLAVRSHPDLEENTRAFNGYGLPVVSVPCGFTRNGMPVGMQPLPADTKVPALSKAAADQTGG